MTIKISYKDFRQGDEVCNMCVGVILKVTKGFLQIFWSWFLANSEFLLLPLFYIMTANFTFQVFRKYVLRWF